MKDMIGNCFLCEEHSLHIAGNEEAQVMQCINCGYVTSTKYIGPQDKNEEYQKLSEDMKRWSKFENGRTWIPSIITLPIGMLYPVNIKKEMKWAFAPMIEIPEEERKKYPNPSTPGKFYDKKIDTDNATLYDLFLEGMTKINNLLTKINKKTSNGE